MANNRDQITVATRLCPQNAETAFCIVEGDPLDQARQYFLGGGFGWWRHRHDRCRRQLHGISNDLVPKHRSERRNPCLRIGGAGCNFLGHPKAWGE